MRISDWSSDVCSSDLLARGGLFAYDFFLYSGAALLRFRDPDLDAARGLINVLVVPLLAVSAARGRDWGVRIHISRQIAFYSASLLFGGAYLVVMSAAGYYVRIVGGTWGGDRKSTRLNSSH